MIITMVATHSNTNNDFKKYVRAPVFGSVAVQGGAVGFRMGAFRHRIGLRVNYTMFVKEPPQIV